MLCQAIAAAPDLELVAAVDPAHAGSDAGGAPAHGRPKVASTLDAVVDAGAEAVVDFTVSGAAMANLRWCAARGLHAVVGTTGLGDDDVVELGRLYPPDGAAGVVVAANFAIGAVLMMRFAELAAPWFPTAEIVELHHDAKLDAPSGTAVTTAARMAAASASWGDDPTRTEVVAGARGGAGPGGIRIHSVRLQGLVAHQEVILGAPGQTLTLRHDSLDRAAFAPGVLAALRAVPGLPGLTVGLDRVLGL